MSEEEKGIIEKLKNGQQTTLLSSIRKCQQLKADNIFITRKEYIDTILALIDKLQKENIKLKEDSISKDKIREVLKDIYFYYGQNNDMFLVDKIRKELLGE